MKDRKFLQHAELVNEVAKQLAARFKPSPVAIKQAIERLIDKEYLERDEQDRRKLKYLVRFDILPICRPCACSASLLFLSASSQNKLSVSIRVQPLTPAERVLQA